MTRIRPAAGAAKFGTVIILLVLLGLAVGGLFTYFKLDSGKKGGGALPGGPEESSDSSGSGNEGKAFKPPPFFTPPVPSEPKYLDKLANIAMMRVPPKPPAPPAVPVHPKPLVFEKRTINHVPFYIATMNLDDPDMFIEMGLANRAAQANTQQVTNGDENFATMLKRYPAALVVNGTFFAKDDYKCVMGNMISSGQRLKFSRWENYGTTFGLRAKNVPEMVTIMDGGYPDWDKYWFSITCGPRLMKDGAIWLHPELERFSDDHVLGIGPRSAMGFNAKKRQLYLVTFLAGLSLHAEAELMKSIGCSDAMNLDGGSSKALAHDGVTVVSPGRNLTNIIVVYDVRHRAPLRLMDSWNRFQNTEKVQ